MSEISVCHTEEQRTSSRAALTLAALGIVFGDIGTSPLYTMKTMLELGGHTAGPVAALGLLSLLIWTLLVVVCLKYVTLTMRADNNGEGGILSLMSLLRLHRHHRPFIVAIGLFGAALIYGDGAITPAISVLSSIEGLKMTAPGMAPYVVPLSVAILLGLFALQPLGTARIGWVFGPVMVLWFVAIGALGLWGIGLHPGVIAALNPLYGLHYLATHGVAGLLVLGGVFLAVTGAEALYADMGHVGARAIRLAWYGLVLPSLLLNYAGQTALFMAGNDGGGNIFFRLCPAAFEMPLIILATLATIIASQAIITGAFSMTQQAINLGWCPRFKIIHTSTTDNGQIYVGVVNWALMIVTVGLTVGFGSSDNLAAAYGIAVSLTMLLTTVLLFVTMREIWRWGWLRSAAVAGSFLCIDTAFFGANLMKFFDGGWVPLALAVGIYGMMVVWRRGSIAMAGAMHGLALPLAELHRQRIAVGSNVRPGTAVFVSRSVGQARRAIVWDIGPDGAWHERIIALSVVTAHRPRLKGTRPIRLEKLGPDFWHLIVRYGFKEKPNLPALLAQIDAHDNGLKIAEPVYYTVHEPVRQLGADRGLPGWLKGIYLLLHRHAAPAHDNMGLPEQAVVEVGRPG